jgi:hypothetical protein
VYFKPQLSPCFCEFRRTEKHGLSGFFTVNYSTCAVMHQYSIFFIFINSRNGFYPLSDCGIGHSCTFRRYQYSKHGDPPPPPPPLNCIKIANPRQHFFRPCATKAKKIAIYHDPKIGNTVGQNKFCNWLKLKESG